jgi:hypothetical protein
VSELPLSVDRCQLSNQPGSPIRRSADPPIRRSADPPIRRSADPPIRRSADPPYTIAIASP